MDEPIRLLLADDHPMFLSGLRLVLAAHPDLQVTAEAHDGESAIAAAAEHQPDVVVMDLHLPQLNGIEATRRIVATSPHIAVLILTMFDDDDSVFAAIRAGARGYLLKGAGHEELVRAVRAVANGEAIFGPGIATRMLRHFTAPSAQPALPELTPREREVLDLIARACNNSEIARLLGLSQKTVRNHVSNIFTKLQVADRAQAIVRARTAGLGD
jgi:DNA-binding NarL/FixJ family response regulator